MVAAFAAAVFGQSSQWVSQEQGSDQGGEGSVFELSHGKSPINEMSELNNVCDYFPHIEASIRAILRL
ncbi:hypothetical protein [Rhodoferax sp.]|uniref:hypothetical protein n=1 Tax=Rhodoferax sp. TaxID=50421 RepID=UPI002617AB21|nr:hypothetical protein [Rhodoferax sp.]MDD2810674.1 hypothetical protein [Rhodoferax sp.]MDD5479610.1 hypothetical protein [Rhodoferax sp.]